MFSSTANLKQAEHELAQIRQGIEEWRRKHSTWLKKLERAKSDQLRLQALVRQREQPFIPLVYTVYTNEVG